MRASAAGAESIVAIVPTGVVVVGDAFAAAVELLGLDDIADRERRAEIGRFSSGRRWSGGWRRSRSRRRFWRNYGVGGRCSSSDALICERDRVVHVKAR